MIRTSDILNAGILIVDDQEADVFGLERKLRCPCSNTAVSKVLSHRSNSLFRSQQKLKVTWYEMNSSFTTKGRPIMKRSKLSLFFLCAAACAGMAFSSINCAGPGSMYGGVDINISDQPVWGPTGYDRADYYYIPDIDCYYSVSERQYIYRDGPNWNHAQTLPSRYSGYDPYHSYKVVINENKPYQNNDNHQAKYKAFKGVKDQAVIRDSRDRKYFVNKDHPEHENWVKEQKR